MLLKDVNYRNTVEPSFFSIELLLVFLKYHFICNYTNLAKNSVYLKKHRFSQKLSIKFTQKGFKTT